MSDRKIQVELTEVEARALAGDGSNADWTTGAEKIRAALPPEYPEGTIAWVTLPFGDRCVAVRFDGKWRTGTGQPFYTTVTNVEPLRVLADDEIAVKRVKYLTGHVSEPAAATFREYAEGKGSGYVYGQLAANYADALDAEATS